MTKQVLDTYNEDDATQQRNESESEAESLSVPTALRAGTQRDEWICICGATAKDRLDLCNPMRRDGNDERLPQAERAAKTMTPEEAEGKRALARLIHSMSRI